MTVFRYGENTYPTKQGHPTDLFLKRSVLMEFSAG